MDVSHSPELTLTLTSDRDYGLVLFHALPYTRQARQPERLRRGERSKLERLHLDLFKSWSAVLRNPEQPPRPYLLEGDTAHLVVRAIDMFVQGIVQDDNVRSTRYVAAAHGLEVLEQVRADIPAQSE